MIRLGIKKPGRSSSADQADRRLRRLDAVDNVVIEGFPVFQNNSATTLQLGETWQAQSYPIFVQNASWGDVEIVRDCRLTLVACAGTLVAMLVLLHSMMTTTTMTAMPLRAAAASP